MDFNIGGALTSIFSSVAGIGAVGAAYFVAGPRQLKPSTTHAVVISARKLLSPWHQSKIVVKDSGVMYLKWGASEQIKVPLKVFSVEVKKEDEHALVLNDKMKINADVMFQVSVADGDEAITKAVGAFNGDFADSNIKAVLESRFDSALRLVAANMDIEQINTQRDKFLEEVTKHLNLADVGFKLNEVALRALTPALLSAYNASNSYDAVGMKKVVAIVQESETMRNETEQQGATKRAETNKVQALSRFQIEREQELARLQNAEQTSQATSEQGLRVAEFTATNEKKAKLAITAAEQETGARDIEKKQSLELAEVARQQALTLATQERTRRTREAEIATASAVETAQRDQEITLSLKQADAARAQATANEARAVAVTAEQSVLTATATATAEREGKVRVLNAEAEAKTAAAGKRIDADATLYVAQKGAEATKAEAQGIADAQEIDAKADANAIRVRAEAKAVETLANLKALAEGRGLDAEAVGKMNEAMNILSDEARNQQVDLERIRVTPEIVEKLASALQNVGNMTILSGLPTGGIGGSSNGASGGVSNIFEDAVSASQRAMLGRTLVGKVLKTFGGDEKIAGNIPDITADLADAVAATPVAPVSVVIAAPAPVAVANDDLPAATRPAAPQAGLAP